MTKDQRNMTQEEGRRTQGANQGQQAPESGAAAQTDNEVAELVGVNEGAGQGGSGRILLGDALEARCRFRQAGHAALEDLQPFAEAEGVDHRFADV